MEARNFALPMERLIILDARGKLDLPASRAALRQVAADPQFDAIPSIRARCECARFAGRFDSVSYDRIG